MGKHFLFLCRETWKRARNYLLVTILKNITAAGISLIDIAGIGYVVRGITNGEQTEKIRQIIFFYIGINLLIAIWNQFLSFAENMIMRKSTNALQIGYMQDCVNIDYHYVQDRTLLNLKPRSMGARPEFFLSLWGKCVQDITKLAGIVALMLFISPLFLFLLGFFSFLIIALQIMMDKKDFEYQQGKAEDDRRLEYLYDVMTNSKFAKEIRINDASEFIRKKYETAAESQKNKLYELLKRKAGAEVVCKLAHNIQLFAVYVFFTYQVYAGKIQIAEYTVMIAAITLFFRSLETLFTNLGHIKNDLKAIDFLEQYQRIVRENRLNFDSDLKPEVPIDFMRADIRFENVSFSYPNLNPDPASKKKILENITFTVHSGEKLAIVGLNGAGKSTLIMLLLRLYHPDEGTIYIDNVDIWSIPYEQYIGQFGVVLQDFALFAYSVRENIAFDRECDEAKMNEILEKSGLKKRVGQMKKGLETSLLKNLDEEGVELSGGEAQKLALARALFKNGSMIIMDEPTSALDPIAEYDFFKHLEELSEEKTTIFVSHRLSSTVFCDHILVLQNGRIVEDGTHQHLMETQGIYHELFHMQARYYEKGAVYED